jgi:hypothetical protein
MHSTAGARGSRMSGDSGHASWVFPDTGHGLSLIVRISHIAMINPTVMEM